MTFHLDMCGCSSNIKYPWQSGNIYVVLFFIITGFYVAKHFDIVETNENVF